MIGMLQGLHDEVRVIFALLVFIGVKDKGQNLQMSVLYIQPVQVFSCPPNTRRKGWTETRPIDDLG